MCLCPCVKIYIKGHAHMWEYVWARIGYVCISVCEYMCDPLCKLYMCMHLSMFCLMFVHTSVWILICVDGLCDCIKQTSMWIYSCACVFACMYVCLCLLVLHEYDFLLAYANVYFCDCWCVCICMHMCGDAWGCPFECFPIPACIYVHMLTSVSVNVCSS